MHSQKKIIFTDLDGTKFVGTEKLKFTSDGAIADKEALPADQCWIGGNGDHWLEHYQECMNTAKAHQHEIIFAVLTKKPDFDDICLAAAKKFKDLFPTFMFKTISNEEHMLVNVQDVQYWISLTSGAKNSELEPNIFSHFIVHTQTKAKTIQQHAERFRLDLSDVILVDNDPGVLSAAAACGICTVDCSHFQDQWERNLPHLTNPDHEDTKTLIQKTKDAIKETLFKICKISLNSKVDTSNHISSSLKKSDNIAVVKPALFAALTIGLCWSLKSNNQTTTGLILKSALYALGITYMDALLTQAAEDKLNAHAPQSHTTSVSFGNLFKLLPAPRAPLSLIPSSAANTYHACSNFIDESINKTFSRK